MARDRSVETSSHNGAEVLPPAHSRTGGVRNVARLAWSVLAYNVAVVLWGAFVRASGSGAGCGRHWPLCNGEVVPRPQSVATLIEATHRATSGIALIAVIVLLVATLRVLPRGHRARRGAVFSTVFIFGEALVGAGLVLFELVAHDASMKRGLSMILHLSNTFLLLGALALTAWWASTDDAAPTATRNDGEATRRPFALRVAIPLALGSVLVLGSSGAIAALGDTLFPATSLREGLAQDLSPMAHAFLRLRLLHPVIALGSGVLVLGAAGLVRALSTSPRARRLARAVTILYVVQFAAGIVNLSLLAPVAMQLVHLLLADATWIALVLMSWEAWAARGPVASAAQSEAVAVS
ncbi:MAG: Heme synthase, cytochrome oxidase biosis protein Cox15-CtaA [Labilithrix sp.]|nr:Heme synthase, cytochrome oxidase biosis protein Cox15-CtaA [Labilithrix sp.]